MIDFDQLRPSVYSPERTIDVSPEAMAEAREHVNDHLNRLGAAHFVDLAENTLTHDVFDMQFGLIEPEDGSREEVILMPGTFGNGAWSHIFARAEAISELAKTAGVADSSGHPLPVLIVAAPSTESKYGISRSDRKDVAYGNFDSIARTHIRLINMLGFGAINGSLYSQAAVLAEPLARLGSRNHDVNSFVVGEYPLSRLGFLKEASGFAAERKKDAIDVIEELFETKQADQEMVKGVIKQGKESVPIMRGMGHVVLGADLVSTGRHAKRTTFVHATHSKVTPRLAAIENYGQAQETLQRASETAERLYRLEVDSNHSFADRVASWAAVVAANLQR